MNSQLREARRVPHPRGDAAANAIRPRSYDPLRGVSIWWDLFRVRLYDLREHWYWMVIGWLVFPAAILFFMRAATAGDPSLAVYVVTGNAVVGLVINSVQSLSSELAWSRQRRDLDYYATLPVSRVQLVLAYFAQSALTSVPGALLNIAAGIWLLGLPLTPHPLFALVIVLCVASMAGIGVAIGVTARSGTQANVVNNLILAVTMFLSPVMVPADRLPVPLQVTGMILPPTYAARAFRTTLGAGDPSGLPLDIAILTIWAVATLYVAVARIEWRQD